MLAKNVRCIKCGAEYPLELIYLCKKCNNILDVQYDYAHVDRNLFINYNRSKGIWRYCSLLPVSDEKAAVTLGEGNTILHICDKIAAELGVRSLFIKDETQEPTGSFKDRPIAVAITKALEFGVNTVSTASSGNAGASVSAYAAKAGLRCVVYVPENTPIGKLVQINMYGAVVIKTKGTYSDAYKLAQDTAKESGWYNVTTTFLSPYPTEGNKTVAYELAEQLGWQSPTWVLVPIGAGPLLVGIYKGFEELRQFGLVDRVPHMVGVQVDGCAPVVKAFNEGESAVKAWFSQPKTVAGGIADQLIGYERDGSYTLDVIKRTGGMAIAVTDQEVLETAVFLGRMEGIFAEPSGIVSVAAVKKLNEKVGITKDDSIVCLVTGHGLKDPKVYENLFRHE